MSWSSSKLEWWAFGPTLVCMWHISNSTAEGQHHAMQGFVLCYRFQHYGFLWISSALVSSLIEVLSIISPSQLTLYYSKWVSLLKVWQCPFFLETSDQYYCGTVRGCTYTGEGQRCLSPKFTVQSIRESSSQLFIFWLAWSSFLPFLCPSSPYRNCEDAIFYKVDGV